MEKQNKISETNPNLAPNKIEDGFNFNLKGLTFNNGTCLLLEHNDLVIIVGGNNTGKSRTLKDIKSHFTNDTFASADYSGLIIKSLDYYHSSNIEEIEHWLTTQNALNDSPEAQLHPPARGSKYPRATALEWFEKNKNWRRKLLGAHCIELLDTETRLTIASPAASISYSRGDPIQNPIQQLYRDDSLEKEISRYFYDAFNEDIIVNKGDGSTIPLHCGERPVLQEDENPVSTKYLEKLIKLPLAHEQGDGMRSFLGCLLKVFVWKPFVTLLDEPEAFLHPPQARYLGSLLAQKKPSNRQIIVATHSGDFLRGVLDANIKNVRIVRLTRDDNVNSPIELSKDDLISLWNDPLLRHSNLLDGVFHDGVVLCEADTDCQFYSAILEALVKEKPRVRRPHLLFSHVGGKERFRTIVPALRCLGVPVRVVADFDILSSNQPLEDIVNSLGGKWQDIEKEFRILQSAMKGQKKELSKNEMKEQIDQIIALASDPLSKSDAEQIRNVVKKSSPWALAKISGKHFVPAGDATQAYKKLNAYLLEIGLHVVDVGEMEGFCKSIGGHGTKWVNSVMQKDLSVDPELEDARIFVAKIWSL